MNIMLEKVLITQLRNNFLLTDSEEMIVKSSEFITLSESSTLSAIRHFNNKYLKTEINPFNSVMYCVFLYKLSRLLYLNGQLQIADKVYYLNKMLNAVDLFYAIELPEIWSCEHPLGSVMGRAKYGENFFFYQGCTVGGNRHSGILKYPVIGDNVIMYSNSKVLGESNIGNNVTVAAETYIINQNIPDNSIVFGQSPNIIIKNKREDN